MHRDVSGQSLTVHTDVTAAAGGGPNLRPPMLRAISACPLFLRGNAVCYVYQSSSCVLVRRLRGRRSLVAAPSEGLLRRDTSTLDLRPTI
jgi:hypothetical protein